MKSLVIRFIIDTPEHYLNDVQDIPRAFSPYLTIDNEAEGFLICKHFYSDNCFTVTINSSFAEQKQKRIDISKENNLIYKKYTKHFTKIFLYDYISEYLNISLPYGSLTGVRPTKLYYDLSGIHNDAKRMLIDDYRVSKQKAELIKQVTETQKSIYRVDNKNCDIFVNIPFCPTRCNYCSFISNEIGRVKNYLPAYISKVNDDLQYIKDYITHNNMNLRSIYVGGGTPTCIGVENLQKILLPLKDYGVEFTVEGGRPDTMDEEILNVMKECNVTRTSINPQTFKEKTLELIGRKHSVADIFKAYEIANKYQFDINMDLIAGLEGESVEDFFYSVDKTIELNPANITIHTLSIKRGAIIRDKEKDSFGQASKMIDYAHKRLKTAGYKPYYMYRQKNMADNLENTGFCKEGYACVYNIDMMEDISTILGAGAGAMTKLYKDNRIERISKPKGIKEYLSR